MQEISCLLEDNLGSKNPTDNIEIIEYMTSYTSHHLYSNDTGLEGLQHFHSCCTFALFSHRLNISLRVRTSIPVSKKSASGCSLVVLAVRSSYGTRQVTE